MNVYNFSRFLRRQAAWLAAAVLATACDQGSPEAVVSDPGPADELTVALVMKTLTNPFFVDMERGARRAEDELGIELLVKTEQQIGIVEDLVRQGVDAIVIAPGDSVALVPVLKSARDAGIVVINIDNRLDPEFSASVGLEGVPFISVDNRLGARSSAAYIAAKTNGPAKALVMEGIRGAINAEHRKQGALDAFADMPDISVVDMQSANWKIEEGYELMKRWLEQHPDVTLLFAANDMMALGAINAIEEAGRDDILVAGFDALVQAREAIGEGPLQATVDQRAGRQGYLGVEYAVRALRGETLPAETLVDTRLVTAENLDD